MTEPCGSLALILHAHLPFVRHPEQPAFLEERWLFEAITETYLPLLERFQRLANDQVPFRIAMSFTPTLLAMWADELLQARYVRHLEQLIELSEKEIERTRWLPPFHRLALFYHHRFTTARRLYVEGCRRNLLRPFRELSDRGLVEPLASCATHGYLPLLEAHRPSVRAQIQLGVQACAQAFGTSPAGFWLPECGYHAGHDEVLKEFGIRYFVVDAHGVLFGSPRPKYGSYAPVSCPSGVVAFARNLESAKSVWSAQEGYPADPIYREFHRDIGFDLDYDYLRPYLNGDGSRVHTGIKYHRITGKTDAKQPYDPDRAMDQSAHHARHFLQERKQQVRAIRPLLDRDPIIVSPYDAELFGHWWFEGPDWLDSLIRECRQDPHAPSLVTPSDYLERHPVNQTLTPSASSWGDGGYSDVWLNGSNEWIYRHLHKMAERMTELANEHPRPDRLRRRVLNQMGRELCLAQASDWAFILKNQTHTAYAYRRLHDHLARFNSLYDAIRQPRIHEPWLAAIEAKDRCFPFLDYRIYATSDQ